MYASEMLEGYYIIFIMSLLIVKPFHISQDFQEFRTYGVNIHEHIHTQCIHVNGHTYIQAYRHTHTYNLLE